MADGIGWLADVYPDGYCVMFARGLDVADLIRRMGGDPNRTTEPLTWQEASALDTRKGMVARVGSAGGWAFALEHWSAQGHDEETVTAVSDGTEAVVLMGAGIKWFTYAQDGVTVCSFEPGQEAEDLYGEDPDRLVPAMKQVGLLADDGTADDVDDEERRMLRLAEGAFSLTLPRAAIENGRLPAVSLSPPPFA